MTYSFTLITDSPTTVTVPLVPEWNNQSLTATINDASVPVSIVTGQKKATLTLSAPGSTYVNKDYVINYVDGTTKIAQSGSILDGIPKALAGTSTGPKGDKGDRGDTGAAGAILLNIGEAIPAGTPANVAVYRRNA